MKKIPAIYIMTNKPHGVLYTGVTSNILNRVYQHKNPTTRGFADKYKCRILVYYEIHEEMYHAIEREKQIKAGSRDKKIKLIEKMNPEWKDLYESILG